MTKVDKTQKIGSVSDTPEAGIEDQSSLSSVDVDFHEAPTEPVERVERVEPDAPTPALQIDESRDDIAKRFQEKRKEERLAAKSKVEDGDDHDDSSEGLSPDADRLEDSAETEVDRERREELSTGKKAAAEPVFTVIEDGKPVQKTQAEIVALAQTFLLKDKEPARELRDQNPDTPAPSDQNAPPSDSARDAKRVDPEKLQRLAERLQVGDEKEGASVLQEVIDMVASQGQTVDPNNVYNIVRQSLAAEERSRNIGDAIKAFGDKYPAIAADNDFKAVSLSMLRGEVLADLKSVGLTDADLAPITNDISKLIERSDKFRASGVKLRGYHELLDTVGANMTTKFKLPPPNAQARPGVQTQTQTQRGGPPPRIQVDPNQQQERIARKQSMPVQPRPAGARGAIKPAPQRKTRAEMVAEARKSRNYPPNG